MVLFAGFVLLDQRPVTDLLLFKALQHGAMLCAFLTVFIDFVEQLLKLLLFWEGIGVAVAGPAGASEKREQDGCEVFHGCSLYGMVAVFGGEM